MAKKKAVGVQLLGRTVEGLVAILQVRSTQNPDKPKPESWAGGCQPTAHGGLEEGEDFLQALWREVAEELGPEFVTVIQALHDAGKLVELEHFDSPEREVITYGGFVEEFEVWQPLLQKETSPVFGGFRTIRRDQVENIVDLTAFDKATGVTDPNVIAMFPNDKEAVRLAFEKLD